MNATTMTKNIISSDKVEGTAVYNGAGEKLGSIADLMIDKHSGQVRFAVLEFGGFLGIGTDRYPLPWKMLSYDTTKEGYVVPVNKDRLKDAPRYCQYEPPDYTLDYDERIKAYYGE